jgi:hypothetical protein
MCLSRLVPQLAWIVVPLLAACAGRDAEGTQILAVPPDAAQHLASNVPPLPYAQQEPGLLARKRYEDSGPSGTRIEVDDLLVGPHQHVNQLHLPGSALLEVNSGAGTLRINGQEQRLQTGATVAVDNPAALDLDNAAPEPLAIRAYVMRAE